MFHVNENYQKLPGSYLFSTIAKKVNAYQEANPDKNIIRLGIGDVTQPLAPAIIEAMHKAVDEMGHAETFHGYAPDLGYEFLRKAIAENDYAARGCEVAADEIFVSDGAKSDSGNIQEIFGQDNKIAVIYGCIFTACHFFCFAKTKEAVITPEKEKISVKVQLKAVMQNRPYLLALVGQILFGFTLYGRNADILYYFTYVEGNASYYTTYSMCIIIPSIIGAACFQPLFRRLNNKGRTASLFALFTGISMLSMFFFNAKESPAIFYALSGLTQFFFSGFNTAIYAIIPDCVEYGEWKTGLRNDGFQYAFISLGNKIGMAVGTALLAGLLGKCGYIANQTQNATVLSIMKHAFTTIPGALWIVTAVVLFFYRLNKKRYNEIVEELKNGRKS